MSPEEVKTQRTLNR